MFIQTVEEMLYSSWRIGASPSGFLERLEGDYQFLLEQSRAGKEVELLRRDIEFLWHHHETGYPVPLARTARRLDREMGMLRRPAA